MVLIGLLTPNAWVRRVLAQEATQLTKGTHTKRLVGSILTKCNRKLNKNIFLAFFEYIVTFEA
jgi:hypothetical protein|tara:strand:- start:1862 stop:2050 length:189 start_codon:yes stop_codon:yes gene_type:complete